MKKILHSMLFAVLLAAIAGPADAKLSINAGVSLKEEFTDNVFLTNDNRESDFITSIFPSISLNYAIRPIDLSLNYGMNFKFYADHSELNETGMNETQALRLKTQFRPTSKIFIDLSDVYQRVPIDLRDKVSFDNLFMNMTDSNTFIISPYAVLPLSSTLSAKIGYTYTNLWYRSSLGNKSEGHTGYVSLTKQLSPALSASINYSFHAQRPDKTTSYDQHSGSARLQYQRGEKFTAWGEYGQSLIDYKDSSDNSRSDFWNTGFNARVFSEDTSIGASYSKSFSDVTLSSFVPTALIGADYVIIDPVKETLTFINPKFSYDKNTITLGVSKDERIDAFFSTGTKLKISVNSYYAVNKFLTTDRKDKILGASLTISHKLSERMNGSIQGVAEKDKFLPEDRSTKRYKLGLNIDYTFSKHISADLGYAYNTTSSDFEAGGFHSNVVWVQGRYNF